MIFHLSNYRLVLKKKIEALPKKGYGQARKLAAYLNCHTTHVSQVLSGSKDLTLEQAILATEFFGLSEEESEYFMLLVQLDRAGNEPLKKNIQKKISKIRDHASELVNRLSKNVVLTEAQRAIFYSDWSYAAIRQCTSIKGLQDVDSIGKHLVLPKKHVVKVLDFLVETGLCKQESNRFVIGPSATHLESTSPWVRTHHMNWRQKAIANLNQEYASKLHYTAAMTLSAQDAVLIREMITKFLEEVDTVVLPSPSEELHCLNIDWFKP
jgi:uncharacterized protein (TIGR02147 family)